LEDVEAVFFLELVVPLLCVEDVEVPVFLVVLCCVVDFESVAAGFAIGSSERFPSTGATSRIAATKPATSRAGL
jgi:hypothetical protein